MKDCLGCTVDVFIPIPLWVAPFPECGLEVHKKGQIKLSTKIKHTFTYFFVFLALI